jgi:hypothetical protein
VGATPKDPDEKERRGYRDRDTIVWIDGRERLAGYDWRKRKKELAKRSEGRCELVNLGSLVHRCTMRADDAHHLVKRSVLRDDRLENLLHVCRYHHRLLDERKVRSDRAERRLE